LTEEVLLQEIAQECFDESAVSNLFLNWISAGWIDISDMDSEDLIGSDKSTHTKFLNSARQATFEAMKTIVYIDEYSGLSIASTIAAQVILAQRYALSDRNAVDHCQVKINNMKA
jgi:hypothetical protein